MYVVRCVVYQSAPEQVEPAAGISRGIKEQSRLEGTLKDHPVQVQPLMGKGA